MLGRYLLATAKDSLWLAVVQGNFLRTCSGLLIVSDGPGRYDMSEERLSHFGFL